MKVDSAELCFEGTTYRYLVVGSLDPNLAELTPAEREVVCLLAAGCSNREIAKRRGSSVHTVGNQLAAVYHKLGVSDRHELVARLAESGRAGQR